MQYTEENNYPKAFGATALIMGVLFALCFLLTFPLPPTPEQGEGGILVNYGTSDEGSGNDFMSMEEPSKSEKANKTQPDKVNPTQNTNPSADAGNQKVVTQNSEDAPVVSDKKNTNTTPTQDEANKPHKLAANSLFKGMKNNGTGQGDGTTSTPGNQGSPNGSNLSDNYGPGGSGNGLNNMPNWEIVNSPDVVNVHRVPGKVFIDFTVDPNGNVIEAHYNRAKTRASLDLIQSCLDATKRTKYRPLTQVSGNTTSGRSWIFKVD